MLKNRYKYIHTKVRNKEIQNLTNSLFINQLIAIGVNLNTSIISNRIYTDIIGSFI